MKKLLGLLALGSSLSLFADPSASEDRHSAFDHSMPTQELFVRDDKGRADTSPEEKRAEETNVKTSTEELIREEDHSNPLIEKARKDQEEIKNTIEQIKAKYILMHGESNWYKVKSAIQVFLAGMGMSLTFVLTSFLYHVRAQARVLNTHVEKKGNEIAEDHGRRNFKQGFEEIIREIAPKIVYKNEIMIAVRVLLGMFGARGFYNLVMDMRSDREETKAIEEQTERYQFLEHYIAEIKNSKKN